MVYFTEKNGALCPEFIHVDRVVYEHNERIILDFIQTKRLEGCTVDTLSHYSETMFLFAKNIYKYFEDLTSNDIREFLSDYQNKRGVTNQTMNNMRGVFSSFFSFMQSEEYIIYNPMDKVHKIRCETQVKKAFSDEEICRLTDSCVNCRELAMIDFLNYTGVRVSELCKLNIEDINFITREGIVKGKGKKERIIYINANVKIHLMKYLEFRIDNNPALFVTEREPYDRLTKSGVEYIVSKVGQRAGVSNCHPHRFRRTLATRLIDRGVPIEQVQSILGHNKLDTTLIYAKVNEKNVKLSHQKFA